MGLCLNSPIHPLATSAFLTASILSSVHALCFSLTDLPLWTHQVARADFDLMGAVMDSLRRGIGPTDSSPTTTAILAHLQAKCRGVDPEWFEMFTLQCPSLMRHCAILR